MRIVECLSLTASTVCVYMLLACMFVCAYIESWCMILNGGIVVSEEQLFIVDVEWNYVGRLLLMEETSRFINSTNLMSAHVLLIFIEDLMGERIQYLLANYWYNAILI